MWRMKTQKTQAASSIPSAKPPMHIQAKLFSRKEVFIFYFYCLYGLAQNVFKEISEN